MKNVRDLIRYGIIMVKHFNTNSMLVYPSTKRLRPIVFKSHIENKGIVSIGPLFSRVTLKIWEL